MKTKIIEFPGDPGAEPEIEITVDRGGNILKAEAWAPGLMRWIDCIKIIMISDYWRRKINERNERLVWPDEEEII